MTDTLVAAGDDTCTVLEKTNSCSTQLNVPLSVSALVALMRELLADTEKRDVTSGPVYIDRMRDGLRINSGSANFTINYRDLFPIVAEG